MKHRDSSRLEIAGHAQAGPEHRRRGVLKSFLAGGAVLSTAAAVPQRWTQPIIKSVVLPAHAQTSLVLREIVLRSTDGDFPHELPEDVESIEFTVAGGEGGGGGGGGGGTAEGAADGEPGDIGFAGAVVNSSTVVSGGETLSVTVGNGGEGGAGGQAGEPGGEGGAGGQGLSSGPDGSPGADGDGGGGGGGEAGGDSILFINGGAAVTAEGGAGGIGGAGGGGSEGGAGGAGSTADQSGGTSGPEGNGGFDDGGDGGDGADGFVIVTYSTAS